ncbi:MAG TPA: AAA family ATPase, partial [Bryobacteraceae bacterium]|nr:AAA family ATPase [Bryobacteraceae bacterium]
YMTSTHREALSGLRYATLAQKGFALLTGDAGTGKTTVISRLVASLPPQVKVFPIFNPVLQPDEFLEYLMLQMGIESIPVSKAQRLMMLQSYLQQADRNGEIPVLVIDEAHKLRLEVLEEVRLLGNFETGQKKSLQIVLAGQSELCELLNETTLRQLKQRIAVRLSLQALSAAQVSEYIAYRWQMSGATNAHPFSPQALAAIANFAKGIPRVVNAICDNALVLMVAESKPFVGEEMIVAVCGDLDLASNVAFPISLQPPIVPVTSAASALAQPSVPPPMMKPPSGLVTPLAETDRCGHSAQDMSGYLTTPFQTLRRYETATKRSLLMRCAAKFGFV